MTYDIKRSGERIRQLRIQYGYTQEKLAGELNIDRSLLSHVEAGKRGCSVDLLIQLADIFDESLDLIILDKEKSRSQLKADITELISRLETLKREL